MKTSTISASFLLILATSNAFADCSLLIKNANEILNDRSQFFQLETIIAKKGYKLLEGKKELQQGDLVISDFITKEIKALEIKGSKITNKDYCASGSFFSGCNWGSSMTKTFTVDTSVLIDEVQEDGLKTRNIVNLSWTLKNNELSSDIKYQLHGRFYHQAQTESVFKLAAALPECKN